MGAPLRTSEAIRLKPTMRSRKLAALDFIKRYFAEWGSSPSLDEIGSALGVSKQRANELVRQLTSDAQIRHTPGKRRGIALNEGSAAISKADALLLLRDLGWRIDNSNMSVAPLTKPELPALPVLDHKPPAGHGGVSADATRGNGPEKGR